MKFFFTRKRTIHFINPIHIYWQHRRQMINDFPASLPPDEEENTLTTTMLLNAVKSYTTRPIVTEQFKKARLQ